MHFGSLTSILCAMKTGLVIGIIGLVALVCLSVAVIYLIEADTFSRLVTNPEVNPSVSPMRSNVLPSLSLGTVAVQTFSGPTMIRSGSGAVISSDGLIVTLISVAPYGSGSYTYQVTTSTGSILRAKAVRWSSGLVLLRVASDDLNAVLFQEDTLSAGTQMTVVGALAPLSRYTPLILSADVAYIGQADDIALSVDKTYSALLAGARIVDVDGRSVGLAQPGTYVRLIPAQTINAVVEGYLAQKK